jgi:GT2 family glycosyltransferase
MIFIFALQRGLLWAARMAYAALPLPVALRQRMRFWLKTRLGVLFGRRRAWSYTRWVRVFDTPAPEDATAIARWFEPPRQRPGFAVVVPAPEGSGHARRHAVLALESVRAQFYPPAQVIVCGSGANEELLAQAGLSASAIPASMAHVPSVSAAEWLRAGLAAATSPWIVLLRHDAALAPDALALLAATWNENPQARVMFGDEDGLLQPEPPRDATFKPRFDPDLLLAQDYFGPAVAIHRDVLLAAGGVREGFGEAVVYELLLRISAMLPRDQIRHVPFVLTHRQSVAAIGAGGEEQRRAVLDHLAQRSIAVEGVDVLHTGDVRVRYPIGDPPPLVTLIVPTRDRVDLLRTCVKGLLERTDYPALELIVVDNRSTDPATLAYLREIAADRRVRIQPYDAAFNFSAMNNLAARDARGAVLALVNNDIAVIEPGWLKELVGHTLRPGVGAVGPKLLYGNGTIQHAGIVLGMIGTAGHVFRHLPGEAEGYGRWLMVARGGSAVTGACLVVRRELYLAVGGLDETMPVSCSDVDLCMRLSQLGHRTIFTPHAVLLHLESVSRGYERTREQWAETQREEAVFCERWSAEMADDPFYSPNLRLDSEIPAPAVPPRVLRPWRP